MMNSDPRFEEVAKAIKKLRSKCAAINRRLDEEQPSLKKLWGQLFSARAENNALSVRVANLEKKVRALEDKRL